MDSKQRTFTIIIIALVLVLGGTVAYLVWETKDARAEKQKMEELQELAEINKLEMQNEYEDFARQYRELQTQITNDSLIAQLEKEQKRAEELLAELQRTRKDDAAEILRLKKELATLRAILRNYVMQIDSLNSINKELAHENENLKEQNAQQTEHISALSTEKETLSDKVAIAAQLNATNIVCTPRKKRKDKETNKAKDVRRFEISFNIARNVTAQTGMKSVYVRIGTPTGNVLTQGGTFTYENRELPYSIRKDVEYMGEEMNVTVYWDVTETLSAGAYRVDIFADGQLIGSSGFSLK